MNKVPRAHTIAVRAYARPSQWKRPIGAGLRRSLEPSEWTLIFDTQTTMDAAQQLHFGSYHVRKAGVLQEVGLFYDPLTVTESECVLMHAYAQEHHLQVLTVEQFVEEVFFRYVSDLGALCVGFHLPFALSRLAIKHSSARGKTMRGGFSFQLSPNKRRPRLQIKHLHSRAALIRLTVPPRQQTPRSMRKRRQKVPNYRGSFVDVKTLASALLSGSWSLGTLAAHLQVGHRLPETEGQGTTLSGESLANVTQNVHVIWECFMQLQQRYRSYGLDRTPITRIYSEASIGKAYLRQMGIRPWQQAQPDFPPPLLGIIMSSLFGGRAEVHVRREVSRVLYCDFLSMYTTVCILLQLWAFVIAEHINWCEITSQVQAFLEQVRLEDLQQPKTWQQLTTWVQIESEDDLLPVRSTYDEQQYAIGLNYLTSQEPLWYTLADCIAAKLLSGRVPKVVQARHFSPSGMQGGLQPIAIAGNPAYWVDPTQQDFYRRLIELRQEVKAELKVCAPEERERLEAEQLALKITANASSYGISVELNVTQEDHLQEMTCYGHTGKPFKTWMNTIEEPGSYFHPLLATLITGAARLMLAITQRLAEESGMSWAFCDTDSLAFVQPSNLRDADFLERVQRIQDWFEPLNPYRGKEPLLKIEAVNYRRDGERMEPLYALAISAKRYVLFNLDEQGKPIIRKASAHGLGHLLPPYDERQSPPSIAPPLVPLTEIGVERWQYDLWYRIVVAALERRAERLSVHGTSCSAGK